MCIYTYVDRYTHIYTLFINTLTCGIGANSPVGLVLSQEFHCKRFCMTRSVKVHYVKPGRNRLSVAQSDPPLLDQRTIIIHI